MKRLQTLSGPAGTAIQVALAEGEDRPEWAATLATWFLHCPGQSVFWDHFLLGIIHLRPVEGVPEPTITVPGATHELLLFALNPENQPNPDDNGTWQPLLPLNFVTQLELPDDAHAMEVAELAAQAVVDGILWAEPPLSGQSEPWLSSMLKTAAHARGEAHDTTGRNIP